MHRKTFSDTEKVEYVLASTKEGVVISDFCKRHGLSRSAYYTWKKDLLHWLSNGVKGKKELY